MPDNDGVMQWVIPLSGGGTEDIPIRADDRLFIVGPNGVGKSALVQHCVAALQTHRVRPIVAHRQTWMPSSNIDLTPKARRDMERTFTNSDSRPRSRWNDDHAAQRLSSVLFDLVAAENERARAIARLMDQKDEDAARRVVKDRVPIFEKVNDLLSAGSLTVRLSVAGGEEIVASHRAGESFSMARLSDGERNAAILAATVLTVEPGTLLIIDEPERHLHRAIIEPFLSALFAARSDCPFIVSTHELALPVAAKDSRVLLPRECQWQGEAASSWELDVLPAGSNLPDDLRQAVLGSRRKILFVEGHQTSLDLPMYSALFDGISVVPRGGCEEVVRAVKGLRDSSDLHWVAPVGLIDRDDREEADLARIIHEKRPHEIVSQP